MQDLNCEDPNIQYKEAESLQDLKQSQHKQLSLELLPRQYAMGRLETVESQRKIG